VQVREEDVDAHDRPARPWRQGREDDLADINPGQSDALRAHVVAVAQFDHFSVDGEAVERHVDDGETREDDEAGSGDAVPDGESHAAAELVVVCESDRGAVSLQPFELALVRQLLEGHDVEQVQRLGQLLHARE
jgi:hypothetical protein